jgi:uncharacterized membrane protein
MLRYFAAYMAALVALVLGDAAWLSYFAKAVFRPTLGSVMLDQPRWPAAILFYLVYAAAVAVFAVGPALNDRVPNTALIRGAFLGLVAYATYDLTNLATLKPWTVRLALMDCAWGVCLTAMAALASYFIVERLAP